ncbi:hypothetical protein GE09DRAFT_1246756, partial [Coniochaeta sp. 2T2.1]
GKHPRLLRYYPHLDLAPNNLLIEIFNNCTDIMANGYDVNKNGNNYFLCIVTELSMCSSVYKNDIHSDSYYDYCFEGICYKTCNAVLGCRRDVEEDMSMLNISVRDYTGLVQVLVTHMVNATDPCPPDYSKSGYGPDNSYEQSVYRNLVNNTGFYADFETSTGIPKDKTKIGRMDRGNGCAPSAKPDDDCLGIGIDYNIIPVINGYSSSDVAKAKDIVSKCLDNAKSLGPQISSIVSQLRVDGWFDDGGELIDSISMPIFRLGSATENMGQVEDIADEITEERRKAFMFEFLSAIFLVIAVIGEVIGAVTELADVGVIMGLLGAAGNAATDIYTIVDDQERAACLIRPYSKSTGVGGHCNHLQSCEYSPCHDG